MYILKRLSLLTIIIAFTLACAGKVPGAATENTFLWEVRKEAQPVSYLLGTVHIGKNGSALSPKIMKAYNETDVLVVESGSETPNQAEAAKLLSSMLNKTPLLPELLGQDTFKKLAKMIGIEELLLAYYKPWSVMTLIAYAEPDGYSTDYGIDFLLMTQAKEDKKAILSLEATLDALELFITLPDDKVIETINYYVDNIEKLKADNVQLLKYYHSNNVAEVTKVDFSQYAGSDEDLDFWTDWVYRLQQERNYKWMNKLPDILAQHSALIATGALHLYGNEGLIELLRANGYVVSPVY